MFRNNDFVSLDEEKTKTKKHKKKTPEDKTNVQQEPAEDTHLKKLIEEKEQDIFNGEGSITMKDI